MILDRQEARRPGQAGMPVIHELTIHCRTRNTKLLALIFRKAAGYVGLNWPSQGKESGDEPNGG